MDHVEGSQMFHELLGTPGGIHVAILHIVFANQFGNNLGIQLTGKDVSAPLELPVKLAAVVDGAIVH